MQLRDIQIAVLDEADHMADMGFMPEVTAILDQMPAGGQRMLFSATLDKGVDKLVEGYLTDPKTHSTDDAKASVTTMEHHVLLIDPMHKKTITAEVANRAGRTVVFVRTKLGADRVALQLREQGVRLSADLMIVPHHGSRTSSTDVTSARTVTNQPDPVVLAGTISLAPNNSGSGTPVTFNAGKVIPPGRQGLVQLAPGPGQTRQVLQRPAGDARILRIPPHRLGQALRVASACRRPMGQSVDARRSRAQGPERTARWGPADRVPDRGR